MFRPELATIGQILHAWEKYRDGDRQCTLSKMEKRQPNQHRTNALSQVEKRQIIF